MMLFVLIAVLVAIGHLVLAAQRPRLGLIVSGALWVLYAVWEYNIANGTLCDKDCNIRVDLVVIIPVRGLASGYGHHSYKQPPGKPTVVGMLLRAAGLVVAAVVAVMFGYTVPAVAAGVGALALVGYAIKLGFAKRDAPAS